MENEQNPPDQDVAGSALLAMLDEIADALLAAKASALSSAVKVNREELLELVEAARELVPQEIRTADLFLADADAALASGRSEAAQISASAHEEAERIIANGHAQAEALVSRDRIVALANERADEIVTAAEAQAEKLAQGARDYCHSQLSSIGELLEKISGQVQAGQDKLSHS